MNGQIVITGAAIAAYSPAAFTPIPLPANPTADMQALKAMPQVRDCLVHTAILNTDRKDNRTAMLGQVVGVVNINLCFKCSQGRNKFKYCVSVPSMFGDACMGCKVGSEHATCTIANKAVDRLGNSEHARFEVAKYRRAHWETLTLALDNGAFRYHVAFVQAITSRVSDGLPTSQCSRFDLVEPLPIDITAEIRLNVETVREVAKAEGWGVFDVYDVISEGEHSVAVPLKQLRAEVLTVLKSHPQWAIWDDEKVAVAKKAIARYLDLEFTSMVMRETAGDNGHFIAPLGALLLLGPGELFGEEDLESKGDYRSYGECNFASWKTMVGIDEDTLSYRELVAA